MVNPTVLPHRKVLGFNSLGGASEELLNPSVFSLPAIPTKMISFFLNVFQQTEKMAFHLLSRFQCCFLLLLSFFLIITLTFYLVTTLTFFGVSDCLGRVLGEQLKQNEIIYSDRLEVKK